MNIIDFRYALVDLKLNMEVLTEEIKNLIETL